MQPCHRNKFLNEAKKQNLRAHLFFLLTLRHLPEQQVCYLYELQGPGKPCVSQTRANAFYAQKED